MKWSSLIYQAIAIRRQCGSVFAGVANQNKMIACSNDDSWLPFTELVHIPPSRKRKIIDSKVPNRDGICYPRNLTVRPWKVTGSQQGAGSSSTRVIFQGYFLAVQLREGSSKEGTSSFTSRSICHHTTEPTHCPLPPWLEAEGVLLTMPWTWESNMVEGANMEVMLSTVQIVSQATRINIFPVLV